MTLFSKQAEAIIWWALSDKTLPIPKYPTQYWNEAEEVLKGIANLTNN